MKVKAGHWFETATYHGSDVLGNPKRCTRYTPTKVYYETHQGVAGHSPPHTIGHVFATLDEFRSVEVVFRTHASELATMKMAWHRKRTEEVNKIRRAFAENAASRPLASTKED